MATSIRACSSRCPAATSASSTLSTSGSIRRNLTESARSAPATCRCARPARTSVDARDARGWPTWKATCAARRRRTARNHTRARESAARIWCGWGSCRRNEQSVRLRRTTYRPQHKPEPTASDNSRHRALRPTCNVLPRKPSLDGMDSRGRTETAGDCGLALMREDPFSLGFSGLPRCAVSAQVQGCVFVK